MKNAPISRTLYSFGEMASENWQKTVKLVFFATSSACKWPFWLELADFECGRNADGACVLNSERRPVDRLAVGIGPTWCVPPQHGRRLLVTLDRREFCPDRHVLGNGIGVGQRQIVGREKIEDTALPRKLYRRVLRKHKIVVLAFLIGGGRRIVHHPSQAGSSRIADNPRSPALKLPVIITSSSPRPSCRIARNRSPR